MLGGAVVDVYVDLVALFVERGRDRDLEGGTEGTTLGAEFVVDMVAFNLDGANLQVAGVQGNGSETGLDELNEV